jgi:ABC-2 type transport system ATP-binding protein
MDAITVRSLRKSYGETEVLRGVDFDVHANEVFGFLGRNGAGKTTTIAHSRLARADRARTPAV